MSIKAYPGGIITKNPTSPTTSAAKGFWTLEQAQGFIKQGIWPRSPSAPTIGSATVSVLTASVPFTAPSNTGSAAITNYIATSSPGGITGSSATSPISVSGLTANTTFTFSVAAVNGAGTGSSSVASNSVTSAAVPGAPTIGTATTSGATASVPFTAPASDGGSTITTYTATSSPGGVTGTLSQAGSGTITVSGLTFNTSYTFTVFATNAIGSSASSAASNAVVPTIPTWLAVAAGTDATGSSTAIDSNNNIYAMGIGQTYVTLIKYNSEGTLQWKKKSTMSGGTYTKIDVDSSNNIYLGQTLSNTSQKIQKINSSGEYVWQKSLTGWTNLNGLGHPGFTVDSSNNAYIGGSFSTDCVGGNYTLSKLNSSGALQWTIKLDPSWGTDGPTSLATDSSGNIFIGNSKQVGGYRAAAVCKLNSSGTVQWTRLYQYRDGCNTPYNTNMYAITTDSSGNVYAAGSSQTPPQAHVVKYNSSGDIQWIRSLAGPNGIFAGHGIGVDSSGNVFVTGNTGNEYTMFIAKWNSSGVIQFQRVLKGVDFGQGQYGEILGYSFGEGMSIDSNDSMVPIGAAHKYTPGVGASQHRWILGMLPNDGTKTGNVSLGGWTTSYAASTYTEGNARASYTFTSPTITSSALTLTLGTDTYTLDDSGLTSSVITL